MSKGVVVIARNNSNIDYVKQAVFLAKRVKKYLNLPTSIMTDNITYLQDTFPLDTFDNVIELKWDESHNMRNFFDGGLSSKSDNFKNNSRSDVYDLTPYDETLLLDSDYVINNDLFLSCFDSEQDLLLYKESYDLNDTRNPKEFEYISDSGCEFYWATCVFFRKTPVNQMFFELIKHIKDEWNHYRRVYQIQSQLFRNDFAFSIALHIMNGFTSNNQVSIQLPGKHYYTIDKDVLWSVKDNNMTFLVHKKKYEGQYTLLSTTGLDVHVMNKFSLERIINNE